MPDVDVQTSNLAPWMGKKRPLIKMPPNPMDKSTVVSVFPRDVGDFKWSLDPSYYFIEAAPRDSFSFVIIGPASWWKEIDEEQPPVEIVHNSFQVAQSFVNDYIRGMRACNMSDRTPGMFTVPGAYNRKSIEEKFGDKIRDAHQRQRNWYQELVRQADILWSRTNGNPLAIDDYARLAAESLGMKDKPWMQDFKTIEMKPCKACGEMINYQYPVCRHCKAIIDPEKAKAMQIQFAL